MTNDYNPDKPPFKEYAEWYNKQVSIHLEEDGEIESWYDSVTDAGLQELQQSIFWTALRGGLEGWNAAFQTTHDGYPLIEVSPLPQIVKKSFESVKIKSYRWNVWDNKVWPNPPGEPPSTAPPPDSEDGIDPEYPEVWYGPNNWLRDFPDIFRARLIATYFDGVKYLAGKVEELAKQTTGKPPKIDTKASPDGYHAVHLLVYHDLQTLDFPNRDDVNVEVKLEIQIVTAIQDRISKLLHDVYKDWRLNGPPPDWQWDHESPEFSVNYLGHTLHYLEGMIVNARNQGRNSP